MFKRRKPRTLLSELGSWFWPHIGWRRAARYFWVRLKRMPGTPHSIAAGFASGAAASATPFVGLHFLTSFAIAFFVRGNYLAAAIGTAVGNPWTFPLIWTWIYYLGCLLLGRDLSYGPNWSEISWDRLTESIGVFFWPMMVGGTLTAMLFWVVFYFPLVKLISALKIANKRKIEAKKKQWQRTQEKTAQT